MHVLSKGYTYLLVWLRTLRICRSVRGSGTLANLNLEDPTPHLILKGKSNISLFNVFQQNMYILHFFLHDPRLLFKTLYWSR